MPLAVMDRRPGPSRVICSTRQPGIGQSLFMLRSMGSDASPFKPQPRPPQSTQTAGEPANDLDDAALERVMCEAPRGALALSGLTVGLLLLAWFFVYAFIFLPRGMVG